MPPEWAPHDFVWIGFPSHAELWEESLEPARAEVAAFALAVHANGRGEPVRLVAADPPSADSANRLAPFAEIVEPRFGDIWLRDTGPIVVANGGRAARVFRFNGWGGKYRLEGDDDLAERLAASVGLDCERHEWVLEGGAIESDGTGLGVTTEQCLLNPNRNPGMKRDEVERRLHESLGFDRLLWLGDGLLGDHTDGHVDNLARFVGEGRIAIPVPESGLDPNARIYADARYRAEAFGLEVVSLPSPGRIEKDGNIVAASYMNFYIGNAAVVVPVHGAPNDAAAVELIGALFPGREAVGLPTGHILTGGGSFHCISQPMPCQA
ncbi:MAG: agmatine deiminase family protein [Sphingosinicella sp.]